MADCNESLCISRTDILIDDECYYFKDCGTPVSIALTYDRIEDAEKEHRVLKNWIYNEKIKVKKVIQQDPETGKHSMQFFGWQAKPVQGHFDLSRFDEYKTQIKGLVEEHGLPDYFKTEKGTVTQASYQTPNPKGSMIHGRHNGVSYNFHA